MPAAFFVPALLWGERYFHRDSLTLLDIDDAMNAAISGHGDVDNVCARIQIKIKW